jgi:hypothetical protein
MKPRFLDAKWKYTPAIATDIRRTFARVRAEEGLGGDRARETGVSYRPNSTDKVVDIFRSSH